MVDEDEGCDDDDEENVYSSVFSREHGQPRIHLLLRSGEGAPDEPWPLSTQQGPHIRAPAETCAPLGSEQWAQSVLQRRS